MVEQSRLEIQIYYLSVTLVFIFLLVGIILINFTYFSSSVKETLSNLSVEHSKIQSLLSSATDASEKYKKLLSSIECLVEKREVQLTKYGFKPTKHDLPSYPELQLTEKYKTSRTKIAQKFDNVSRISAQKTTDGILSTAIAPALTPAKINEAVIAKYTPAKRKLTNQSSESASIQPSILSKYNRDAGDKTYVITQASADKFRSTVEVHDDENESKKPNIDIEQCFAKYDKNSSHDKANETISGLSQTLERFSTNPHKNTPAFVAPSQPSSEAKTDWKDVGSLLSKYSVKPSQAHVTEHHDQKETRSTSILSPSIPLSSPATTDKQLTTQKQLTSSQHKQKTEESFSAGFMPNDPCQSLAFDEEELERTVCVPHSSLNKKTHLSSITNEILTPEVPKRTMTKISSNSFEVASNPLISKTESQMRVSEDSVQTPRIIEEKKDRDIISINNENIDSNCNPVIESKPISSLSSIVSKYSKKYHNSS